MFEMDTTGLASLTVTTSHLHALVRGDGAGIAWQQRSPERFEVPTDDVAGSDSPPAEMIRDAGDDVDSCPHRCLDEPLLFFAEPTTRDAEVTSAGSGYNHDPNVALSRAITGRPVAHHGNQRGLRGPPNGDLPPLGWVHTYAKAKDVVAGESCAVDTVAGARCRLAAWSWWRRAATAATGSALSRWRSWCDSSPDANPVVKVLALASCCRSASPMRTPQEAE